jgi:glycosyltransferase involved in cell wall biosynthesis
MYHKREEEIMQNWKGNHNNTIVSICNITYNHESYIAEAIDSFLMQETDFPFEVLISEDCSTDNTASIIREYEKKYPNIIKPIYHKENQYSKGIKMNPTFNFPRAKGKYIALCEGDDYWTDPLKLQKQVDFLEVNSEYIITYHEVRKINESNEFIIYSSSVNYDVDQDDLKTGEKYIQTCTVVFRNVPLQYTGGLKKAFAGDIVLWHLLSFLGKSKYIENIDYAVYREHQNGAYSGLNELEKFLKIRSTRFCLSESLKGKDRVLQKRVEDAALLATFNKLFASIMSLDKKSSMRLLYFIKNEKEIKKYKLMLLFLKRLNSKFTRTLTGRVPAKGQT